MINEITADAESRMKKSIEAIKNEFKKIRTGRAHPSLLEHITISYYGVDTPLNQVASVTVADPRTLAVVPWEKTMVQPIEKAIMSANMGLNPATSGTNIHVPLPALTEERRREMVKLIRAEAETGKIAIRNIRREMNHDFKDLLKEKEISEDEEHQAEDTAQKLTDKYVAQIDVLVGEKEKELMEV